jgi:Flp pilus assembly protein TadG
VQHFDNGRSLKPAVRAGICACPRRQIRERFMQGTLFGSIQRLIVCDAACRLLRQQGGAAAVEFDLVAAPFLALVFAIIETAIVFFAGQALETAASDSSRLI